MKKSNSLPRKTLFITSKRAKSTKEGEKKKSVERDCHSNQIRHIWHKKQPDYFSFLIKITYHQVWKQNNWENSKRISKYIACTLMFINSQHLKQVQVLVNPGIIYFSWDFLLHFFPLLQTFKNQQTLIILFQRYFSK